MTSAITPLDIEAMPAPPAERLTLSLLWWFTPVAAGLLYIIISHFVLNAGHLNVTGIIKHKEVMVSVVNDTTVSIGGSVDMSYALKKTGKINPIPDYVSYNLTVASLMNHALVSTFSSSSYNISENVKRVWFEPRPADSLAGGDTAATPKASRREKSMADPHSRLHVAREAEEGSPRV